MVEWADLRAFLALETLHLNIIALEDKVPRVLERKVMIEECRTEAASKRSKNHIYLDL